MKSKGLNCCGPFSDESAELTNVTDRQLKQAVYALFYDSILATTPGTPTLNEECLDLSLWSGEEECE